MPGSQDVSVSQRLRSGSSAARAWSNTAGSRSVPRRQSSRRRARSHRSAACTSVVLPAPFGPTRRPGRPRITRSREGPAPGSPVRRHLGDQALRLDHQGAARGRPASSAIAADAGARDRAPRSARSSCELAHPALVALAPGADALAQPRRSRPGSAGRACAPAAPPPRRPRRASPRNGRSRGRLTRSRPRSSHRSSVGASACAGSARSWLISTKAAEPA